MRYDRCSDESAAYTRGRCDETLHTREEGCDESAAYPGGRCDESTAYPGGGNVPRGVVVVVINTKKAKVNIISIK